MGKQTDLSEQNRARIQLVFEDNDLAQRLFGQENEHLLRVAKALDLTISARGNKVTVEGDASEAELARSVLTQLYGIVREGHALYHSDIDRAVSILSADHKASLKDVFLETVCFTAKKRPICPKSLNQKAYIEAIRNNDMVFGIGPAGTGKTYLAMAMAVAAFSKGLVDRIVLTRPAVEAGEALGFLPGDLAEKVNPYLRPLYDALHDMVSFEKAGAWMEKGAIEVAPLAFMRGRTLNNAFIILDEAQNTTSEQMKMFLTRIGFNSKAVITGDITQIDLPNSKASGLIEVKEILKDIPGINFTFFTKEDVVRHRLVCDIIRAYEELEARKAAQKGPVGQDR
ncbi:MAG: PhoH family protein [Deltaproteobacteria bacterium]|nr:PhoH family protein [Deltaproteobacteria bacterium]